MQDSRSPKPDLTAALLLHRQLIAVGNNITESYQSLATRNSLLAIAGLVLAADAVGECATRDLVLEEVQQIESPVFGPEEPLGAMLSSAQRPSQ